MLDPGPPHTTPAPPQRAARRIIDRTKSIECDRGSNASTQSALRERANAGRFRGTEEADGPREAEATKERAMQRRKYGEAYPHMYSEA